MPELHLNCQFTGAPFVVPEGAQRILNYFGMPMSRYAPLERHRRRLAFRNERQFFRRKCDLTGQEMVSIFEPNSDFKVYTQEAWWSDAWTPPEAEFDFKRPFLEQFRELQLRAPRMALLSKNNENARYANHSSRNRNGYMLFSAVDTEDCFYDLMVFQCKDVVDSAYVYNHSELCYECFFCDGLYHCSYCVQCFASQNLHFCFDCQGCQDCFLSSNLRRKQYYFMNEPLSKEDYEAKVAQFKRLSHADREALLKQFHQNLKEQAVHPAAVIRQCENVQGDFLINCKDALNAFFLSDAEDVTDAFQGEYMRSIYSMNNCADVEMLYEAMGIVGSSFSACINYSYDDANCFYVDHVFNSQDCFACVGIKNARYRILNKEYSPEDYEVMKARIIEHMKQTGEWGEFFWPQLSPFPYNHTIAHQIFPLTREQALAQGYRWSDVAASVVPEGAISAGDLPQFSYEADDTLAQQVLVCEASGRPFRILAAELNFYKKMGLPLPRKHPELRHEELLKFRPPMSQSIRSCTSCGVDVLSSLSPEKAQKLFCESCYLKEVY